MLFLWEEFFRESQFFDQELGLSLEDPAKTERLSKVIIKSSPILFLSYYMLYIYCWNGQRLTDTCEELFRALYRCQWYNCPQSFKTSLLIMMQCCNRPIKLTGGGIFTASFETFLRGMQQSISYILILKQLTPKKTK